MSKLLEYNKLFKEIVTEFWERFCKEAFNEDFNINDIDIIDYKWVPHMVDMYDEYYSLENMLLVLEYNIPIKILREWYDKDLSARLEDKTLWINLYNFYLREKDNEWYYENEFQEVKDSEGKVEQVKQELEKLIK